MNLKSFLSLSVGLITLFSALPALSGPNRPLSSPGLPSTVPPGMLLKNHTSGNITSTDNSANAIACNNITIELSESIPQKPIINPGGFGDPSPSTINTIAKVTATGNNLASGCTYAINNGGRKSVKNDYGESSFRIKASHYSTGGCTGGGLFSTKNFKEIPSTLDLLMEYYRGVC
jgi:hypothetical protein